MAAAVMELQGATAANRLLWEGPTERGRTFLLFVLAIAGGAARARIAGGTDVQSGLVGFGRAAELLSRERVASKQTVAAVREPLIRAATPPLMRCSDPAVVTATEQLLNALSDGEDTARLEAALEALGRAGPSTPRPGCGCPGGHAVVPRPRPGSRAGRHRAARLRPVATGG
ncbi:hypothetical protein [Streptomyces sp. SID161]|uniref:hypothetical protein n=1 Tax=Streptomyces sp. SID161 TaxID=2690251 RepID=UPI00136F892B|nr:hypothetical protein [Streptomyces sp. SID161]MYW46279.1 hypothetical protein [Streptomyces sp. SID161]